MAVKGAMGSTLVMRLVLERLDVNNRALNGRLVCKDASEFLRLPRHWTVRFSQPLPTSAGGAAWQPHLLLAFRGLTFAAKWQALQTAVASGSEANLELAWGLLRPCLFPEVTVLPDYSRYQPRVLRAVTMTDTGSAAIRSRPCSPATVAYTELLHAGHRTYAGRSRETLHHGGHDAAMAINRRRALLRRR